MLTYAKQKCNVPEHGESWVIATIGEAWKQFKKRIKELHYPPYQSFRDMLKNRPTIISEDNFRKLVRFWNYEVTSVSMLKRRTMKSLHKLKCLLQLGQTEKNYVKDLKESGQSDEETFDVPFGKERYGRVRLYGRGVTKTSLKKDNEIEQVKQQHKDEISNHIP